MPEVSIAMAFAAGVVSFLSPCILPVVPGISFISGVSLHEMSEKAEDSLLLKKKRAVMLKCPEKATGVIMIVLGGLIFTDKLLLITAYLPFLNRFVL